MQEQYPPEQAGSGMEPQNVVATMENERRIRGGAYWLYLIAALSFINTVIVVIGNGTLTFAIGLVGISQFINGFAEGMRIENEGEGAAIISVIAFLINMAITGMYALCGVFARRNRRWAFMVGMLLYFLDALIVLVFGIYIAVAFHGWVLFTLWRGLQALDATSKNVAPDSYSDMSAG